MNARTSAITTGPRNSPIGPNAATPPIAPMKTGSVEISARPEMKMGRRKLSASPTTPSAHAIMKIVQPHSPWTASAIVAGTMTRPVPTAGMSEATAPITPNTTGDGSGEIQNAMPIRTPWTAAVSTLP